MSGIKNKEHLYLLKKEIVLLKKQKKFLNLKLKTNIKKNKIVSQALKLSILAIVDNCAHCSFKYKSQECLSKSCQIGLENFFINQAKTHLKL